MKNVKQRLAKVKNTDASVYKQLMDDIRVLQTSAVDEESFLALYNLLKQKWLKQHIFFDPELKIKVNEFIEYFTKTWVNSDERNWYQAANPQHLTTNNNVEGTNQAIKKEYTGRTRLSFPNMFKKLKALLSNWTRTNHNKEFDAEKIPVNILKLAEELIDKCNREDKEKNLLLSKQTKPNHRNMIKTDYGVIRGYVQEVNIIPRNPKFFSKSKKEFAAIGQKIHARRNKVDYKTFDEFKADTKDIAIVEMVFKDKNKQGAVFFACSLDSGLKMKRCAPMWPEL